LALQVATELLADFKDGVYAVRLDGAFDAPIVISAIAQALDVKEIAAQGTLLVGLKEYLSDKQLLLVLDNFEQVLVAGTVVTELLASAAQLKVLVTSREVLHVYNEQEYPVSPLGLPDLKLLHSQVNLELYPAVQLFVERASLVQPGFTLTEQNSPIIAELVTRLDGLPLALELAAGRLKLFSPQVLLERFTAATSSSEARLKMLSGGARDMPSRQQTMRNTLEWSYNLLEPAEQHMYEWLGVFMGGGDLHAITAVCGESDQTLEHDEDTIFELIASLVNKSLLRQVATPSGSDGQTEIRFKMLETLREYALERLTESGQLETARQGHAAYYLKIAQQAEPLLQQSEQLEWLRKLELEHDNLRAVLDWSLNGKSPLLTRERVALGLELAKALWLFWSTRGYISEGRERLTLAITQARKVGLDNTLDYAKALNGVGHMIRTQGENAAALSGYTESLEIFRRLNNLPGVAASLNNLGIVTMNQGDYEQARSYYEQSLTIRNQLGDKSGMSRCLNNLGVVTTQLGDYEAAKIFYHQSLNLSNELGDKIMSSTCLMNLGEVAMYEADYNTAQKFVEESLAICQELGDGNTVASCCKLRAEIAICQGDVELAQVYYKQASTTYQELGNKQGLAEVIESSAVLSLLQDDYTQVYMQLRDAINMLKTLGDKRTLVYALEGMGALATVESAYKRAVTLFSAATALRSALGVSLNSNDRPYYNQYRTQAQNQLSADECDEAWQAGQALSLEAALTYALDS
jgi:predicted ATPase/Tfp pilus assembly protein PilF